MNVAIIILISILCCLVISLFIYMFLNKNKNSSSLNINQSQDIGVVKDKINNIDKLVEKSVQLVMAKETIELTKKFQENSEQSAKNLNHFQSEITESFQKRVDSLNKQLDDKINQLDKKVDDKLKEGFKGTTESMTQVRERLKAIDEAQKQMEGLGKQVISLKNVLEGNQTRGQYGEYQLSMVLHNVFGDTENCYEEQYTMKKVKDGDDVRADAVVFMPEPYKLIAIDSKFPFKDYERIFESNDDNEKLQLKKEFATAVKKHITDIKDKYIVDGKTAPEALMFIPNDGVFAYVHHELQEIIEYARDKRVVLTSPSTLPMILFTFNMVRIDAQRAKDAKEISKQLSKLGKDFEIFGRDWNSFSNQLSTVTKTRERLDNRVGKITSKFDSISNSSIRNAKENTAIEMNDDSDDANEDNT